MEQQPGKMESLGGRYGKGLLKQVSEKFSEISKAYEGKKVLVTGHTGFKGAWLAYWLVLLGADVVGYALEPYQEKNLYNILGLKSKINSMIGDIRDEITLSETIFKQKPDFVFHLAAQSLVRESYKNPRLTYETNIMGTVNLFESLRNSGLQCVVVNVTSDKCYRNTNSGKFFTEDDPMGGSDPYSSSKGAAELLTYAYKKSFFSAENYGVTHKISVSTARGGNVIGGGDWSADRLIPDIVNAVYSGQEIVIRNSNATRPWQHVLDCIAGYLTLGAKMSNNPIEFNQGWNFGPDETQVASSITDIMDVESVVKYALDYLGKGSYSVVPDKEMKEAQLLMLDSSKSRNLLGWKPYYGTKPSIEKTLDWYKIYYSGNYCENTDIVEFSRLQIEEYYNV